MDELNDKIEVMTQETADALIEAFEMFNKSMEESHEMLEHFSEAIYQQIVREVASRFFDYVEKFTCASFLTRWYWKRKAINAAKALIAASKLIEEV
jgi:hypothetical protein